MSRYVILEHDHPMNHWDLMLQKGDVLRTWRLTECPQAEVSIPAEPSFDHRLFYLDYEGPVSGGRGCVVRWDAGELAWLGEDSEQVTVRLEGQRYRGVARIARGPDDRWTFTFNAKGPESEAQAIDEATLGGTP